MKEFILPYELALLARQKGFNELCCFKYIHSENGIKFPYPIITEEGDLGQNQNSSMNSYEICAPLTEQLLDWIRESKRIQIIEVPKCNMQKGYWQFSLYHYKGHMGKFESARKRKEALHKTIETVLNLLQNKEV